MAPLRIRNNMKKKIYFFILIYFFNLNLVFAEKADFSKPTNVEANQMFYDENKQTNTFTGNVILKRGTLIMHAEKLVVRQDEDGNQFATLYAGSGELTTFRQKRDGDSDMWIEGSAADRIEYDSKTEVAKLYKSAKIMMLENGVVTDEIEGEMISYDSRAEFYSVTNSTSGKSKDGVGRVRAIIQPRNKKNLTDE